MQDADFKKEIDAIISLRSDVDANWQKIDRYFDNGKNHTGRSFGFLSHSSSTHLAQSTDIKKQQKHTSILTNITYEASNYFYSNLIGDHKKWCELEYIDERDRKAFHLKRWLVEANKKLEHLRTVPNTHFKGALLESIRQLLLYGNCCVGVSLNTQSQVPHPVYVCIDIRDIYLFRDQAGEVKKIVRVLRLTAEEIKINFNHTLSGVDHKHWKSEQKIIYHYCFEYQGKWLSVFLLDEQNIILKREIRQFAPYVIGHFNLSPQSNYGHGPALPALSDAEILNRAWRSQIRASEKLVDPPIITSDLERALNLNPGGINTGMIDAQGKPLAQTLNLAGNPQFADRIIASLVETAKKHFMIDLFSNISDPRYTATQIAEMARAKGDLLSPRASIIEESLLAGIVKHEIENLKAIGILADNPYPIQVVFKSRREELRRVIENAETQQSLSMISNMAQLSPQVLDVIDFDRLAQDISQSSSLKDAVRSSDEIEELRRTRAEQQAQAQAQQQQLAMIAGQQ
ncbi:MAG: portal protein [Pseudomonadota bacterium]